MSDLTAIDTLMLPDETMLGRAGALNKKLRSNTPSGFALDARHTPHITMLQRYVRTDKLDEVFAAIEGVVTAVDPSGLSLRGVKVAHMEVSPPGMGLAAIVSQPGPGILDLQSSLIEAVEPFTEPDGTAAAYVTSAEEPDINEDTLRYVNNYVPDHSGENFLAHVTIGTAEVEFLKDLESKPFDGFDFHPAGFAVFQLGNNGTAQREVKRWDLAASEPSQ